MNERMICILAKDLRSIKLRLCLVGLLVGIGITLPLFSFAPLISKDVVDHKMERACRWPTQEGEMTVITIEQDKVKCWVWG